MFATADWDEPYWTNKQHSASTLTELGVRVLYIESVGIRAPKALSSRDWKRIGTRLVRGLRSLIFGAPERAPGLFVLSPLVLPAGHSVPIIRSFNLIMMKLGISRSTYRWNKSETVVWTYHPFMLDVAPRDKYGPLLYHCVDDLAAVPGVEIKSFRTAENALLISADVVFATSPLLAERCKKLNTNTFFLPNVVDAEHFGKAFESLEHPRDLHEIPEPRLGYHGVLSDFKIDFDLLLKSAVAKPEWQWVFIGEEREGQSNSLAKELANLPNVHFLGYRPYSQLPYYLSGLQVGLLPSLINEYTQSMFPMKYYEYIAAGLPVASTNLDALKRVGAFVEYGGSVSDFCSAIETQLNRGRLSHDMTKKVIGDNTWKGRTIRMLEKMNELKP